MAVDNVGRVLELPMISYLHPEDQVLAEMLTGWRNQQLSRNLQHSTIEQRERLVRRFFEYTNEYPWCWTPAHVDEFFGDLRSERRAKQSTIRNYQDALRAFCSYVSTPEYGWDRLCEKFFGTHPAQVCFEWNTARHVQDAESDPGKRAFTRRELQDLFDRADDEVTRIAASDRKGWLPAFRDSVMFKVAYGWGLRRNEVRHLQTVDFVRNPHAGEFGKYGVLHVRFGKAMRGSPPETPQRADRLRLVGRNCRRLARTRPPAPGAGLDLFVSERGTLASETALLRRFRRYCEDLNLAPGPRFPLAATLLRHPPDRSRHGRAVRAATGGPRACLDHCPLHLRVERLPHSHAAARARFDTQQRSRG